MSTPREHVLAVKYGSADELPRIIAAGAGDVARQILELAEEYKLPIQEESELASMLAKLPPRACLSEESYKLAAEILSFLFFVDKKLQNNTDSETVTS